MSKTVPNDYLENIKYKSVPAADTEQNFNSNGIFSKFIEMRIEDKKDRISSLKDKNNQLLEKIQRNKSKIEKFTSKVSKLEKQNIFLQSIANAYPKTAEIIRRKIESNERKISKLIKKKIPEKKDKILKHKKRISKNNQKINRIALKIRTSEHLRDYLLSFKLYNVELRQQKLMDYLKAINNSSKFKLNTKIPAAESKLNDLIGKREFLLNARNLDSVSHQKWCDKKIDSYSSKIDKITIKLEKMNNKLNKLNTLESGINGIETLPAQQKSEVINKISASNVVLIEQNLFPSLEKLSETSLVDNILNANLDFIKNTSIYRYRLNSLPNQSATPSLRGEINRIQNNLTKDNNIDMKTPQLGQQKQVPSL